MMSLRVLITSLCLLGLTSTTQTGIAHADTASYSAVIAETRPLASFTAQPGPLRLAGASDEAELFVPVSGAVSVVEAVLSLRFINSIALAKDRSVLVVRLNDTTIDQIPLNPDQPAALHRFNIPSERWTSGFNRLTLSVAQHYTNACEDPDAPELWTEIDLANSDLTISFAHQSSGYKISDLTQLVSPGFGGFDTVQLFAANAAAPEVAQSALSLTAQALALRRGYLPLAIETSFYDLPADGTTVLDATAPVATRNGLRILVGTVDDLWGQVSHTVLDQVTGPTVSIAGANGFVRLIVTGPTPGDVVTAAQNLAVLDDNLNDTRQIGFLSDGAVEPRSGHRRAVPGTTYALADLGVRSRTVTGRGTQNVAVTIPAPTDFYTYEGAQGELTVHFNYGPGLAAESFLAVSMNGEFLHGVRLENGDGASFSGYRIVVPGRSILPGDNIVQFSFNLFPAMRQGECAKAEAEHLRAQLLESSSFTMPPGGGATVIPDLALLSGTAVPFSRALRVDETGFIYITSPELRGTALGLAGRLAQVAGGVLPNLQLVLGIPDEITAEAIILAPKGDIPAQVFAEWQVALGDTSGWPYEVLQTLRSRDDAQGTRTIVDTVRDLVSGRSEDADSGSQAINTLTQTNHWGDMGVLTAFRNPWSDDPRMIAVATAEDHQTLNARMAELLDPGLWGQIRGNFVAWRPENQIFTTTASKITVSAPDDFWLRLRLHFSINPQIWLGAAALFLILLLVSAYVLLRRRIDRLAEDE